MSAQELKVSSVIPTSPNRIYAAWMDERHHSAMTGSRATVDPWVGGRVTAGDGYIDARHVQLDTGRRLLLKWRTTDFPKGAEDSEVEITLEPVAGGTKVTITQWNIPEGQTSTYKTGWRKHYLDPMKKYFGKPAAMRAAYTAAKKAGQLPLSGIKANMPAHRPHIVPVRLEEPEEPKPKRAGKKREEPQAIDLRDLAKQQAEARREAQKKRAEARKKAAELRKKVTAQRQAEAKRKREIERKKAAEEKRRLAAKKKLEQERKRKEAAKKKATELKRRAAEKKKKEIERKKKAAAKKKADAAKKKKAAAKKKAMAAKKKKAAAKKKATKKRRSPTTKRRTQKRKPAKRKPAKRKPTKKKRTQKKKPAKKRSTKRRAPAKKKAGTKKRPKASKKKSARKKRRRR